MDGSIAELFVWVRTCYSRWPIHMKDFSSRAEKNTSKCPHDSINDVGWLLVWVRLTMAHTGHSMTG